MECEPLHLISLWTAHWQTVDDQNRHYYRLLLSSEVTEDKLVKKIAILINFPESFFYKKLKILPFYIIPVQLQRMKMTQSKA